MNEAARRFIERWVDDNVHAEGYAAEGNMSKALALAERCRIAAQKVGLSKPA